MLSIVSGLFIGLLEHYKPIWERKKEKQKWDTWEEFEEMASDMGHTTDIVKIPRPKPPRKKHRH